MAEKIPKIDRALQEAADWLTLLNSRTVSTASVAEFRAWRSDPANAAAYDSVESVWKRTLRLKGDPELQKILLNARKPKRGIRGALNRPGGRGLAAASVAVLAGVLVLAGLRFFDTGESYSTRVGEERLVRLDDGSRVRLDTDTKVRVQLTGKKRRVELTRGRAFFEVAHDASRPFVVVADRTDIRALGTQFDVRRDGSRVDVILVEGRVLVKGPDATGEGRWILKPGQTLQLDQSSRGAGRVTSIQTEAATSWTTGKLTFSALPLGAAVDEVNRYSPNKVVLDVAALASTPVSGVFNSGDTNAFVAAVCDLYDLKAERDADGTVRLKAPQTQSPQFGVSE